MPARTYYVGVLDNVDESILKFNLGYGFKIKKASFREFSKFIHDLTGGSMCSTGRLAHSMVGKTDDISPPDNDMTIYYIFNECIGNQSIPRKDGNEPMYTGEGCDMYEVVDYEYSYVEAILRLMRLYQEGNIKLKSCINSRDDISSYQLPRADIGFDQHITFHIYDSDMKKLTCFVKNTNLPTKWPYLLFAFNLFEMSYKISYRDHSYLSLMIGLEVLFNNKSNHIARTISRRCSSLLGDKVVEKELMNLYKKRCLLIHEGMSNISEEDLLRLRDYVRKAIKKIILIDKEKGELIKMLDIEK